MKKVYDPSKDVTRWEDEVQSLPPAPFRNEVKPGDWLKDKDHIAVMAGVAGIGHNGGPTLNPYEPGEQGHDEFEAAEKSSAERKGEPIHSGVLCYFPDALAAVSRVSKAGNDKHNPGEPLHWSRGKSNDHMDCVARHIITPDEIDPDSGE